MINRGDILISLATEGNVEMITRLVELYGANVNHVHSKDVVRRRQLAESLLRFTCAELRRGRVRLL
jgi:hypothetical protein